MHQYFLGPINKAQLYYNAVDDKYVIHLKMPFEESHFLPAIDSKSISVLYCIKFCNKVTEGHITECMDRRNSNSVTDASSLL